MLNSDYANIQDKTLPKIMPIIGVKYFIFFWSVGISGSSKVAFDNLESSKVCSTPVAQRSSAIAVETGLF